MPENIMPTAMSTSFPSLPVDFKYEHWERNPGYFWITRVHLNVKKFSKAKVIFLHTNTYEVIYLCLKVHLTPKFFFH